MNTQKSSAMSGAMLWQLYRRLLAQELLAERLPTARLPAVRRRPADGIAAALTENLLPGDTLGLAPDDLATRYLCGLPLAEIRAAATLRRGARKRGGWALAADAEQGLLPAAGEEQATLAVGASLAARLHHSGGITVLLDLTEHARPSARAAGAAPGAGAAIKSGAAAWEHTVHSAIALHLPLLFLCGEPFAWPTNSNATPRRVAALGPRRPPSPMPSIPVDRNDALALYRVIYESAQRAREGGGPTWIQCSTWKLSGHVAGDASGPVPRAGAGNPAPGSALEALEQALRARKLFDRRRQRQIQDALEKEFAEVSWPAPPTK